MNPEPHGQYMPPPQPPYSGMPSYPPNTPPRGIPEWARGLISAALLLPLVPMYYLYDVADTSDLGPWFGWGVSVGVALYFVIVVCAVGRSSGRRIGAGAVALVAGCISLTPSLVLNTGAVSSFDLVTWLLRLGGPIGLFGYTVAWGIARRRHSAWLVGLVPALGLAVLSRVLYENLDYGSVLLWLQYLAIDAGLLVLSCLLCWGAEAIGRAIGSPRVGQPPAGYGGPGSFGPPNVNYNGPSQFAPQPGPNPFAPQPGPNPFAPQPGPNPFGPPGGSTQP